MKLSELIPDTDVLYGLEPDELGLRILPVLADWDERHRSVPLTLDDFVVTVLGDGRGYPGEYPPQDRRRVEEAIREAWAWLEGTAMLIKHRGYREPNYVRSLSRYARKLAELPDARRVVVGKRLPREALHPTIREDVWALFHRGKYDTAVFEAMKAVEIGRDVAGLTAGHIGVPLMRDAFKEDGPLTDRTADKGERDARAHLFAGAMGSFKNPHSHRNVALDDPDEAAEIIMLANLLLRIVDGRKSAT